MYKLFCGWEITGIWKLDFAMNGKAIGMVLFLFVSYKLVSALILNRFQHFQQIAMLMPGFILHQHFQLDPKFHKRKECLLWWFEKVFHFSAFIPDCQQHLLCTTFDHLTSNSFLVPSQMLKYDKTKPEDNFISQRPWARHYWYYSLQIKTMYYLLKFA